jgi:hypothetical protein
MVLIGACGNADSKSTIAAEFELSECVTTLAFMATSHTHEGSSDPRSSYVSVHAPRSRVDIAEVLKGYCGGCIDSELLAKLQSGATGIVPTPGGEQALPQAPPTGLQPVPPLGGN